MSWIPDILQLLTTTLQIADFYGIRILTVFTSTRLTIICRFCFQNNPESFGRELAFKPVLVATRSEPSTSCFKICQRLEPALSDKRVLHTHRVRPLRPLHLRRWSIHRDFFGSNSFFCLLNSFWKSTLVHPSPPPHSGLIWGNFWKVKCSGDLNSELVAYLNGPK